MVCEHYNPALKSLILAFKWSVCTNSDFVSLASRRFVGTGPAWSNLTSGEELSLRVRGKTFGCEPHYTTKGHGTIGRLNCARPQCSRCRLLPRLRRRLEARQVFQWLWLDRTFFVLVRNLVDVFRYANYTFEFAVRKVDTGVNSEETGQNVGNYQRASAHRSSNQGLLIYRLGKQTSLSKEDIL